MKLHLGTASAWTCELWRQLSEQLARSSDWAALLHECRDPKAARQLHVGVFVEPFLDYIIQGTKTIESRFSKNLVPPYRNVQQGDVVALKRSSGAVVGLIEIGSVWFYELDRDVVQQLRQQFGAALCAMDSKFWSERSEARVATLMQITRVLRIPDCWIKKRDRRGWVVIPKHRPLPLFAD